MSEQATAAKARTEVESVKMDDGRVVEFPGKRKLQKETLVEGDAVFVRLDWRNGETRKWQIPTALILRAAGHGGEQKLGDAIAGLKDTEGRDASLQDCIDTVDELIERLNGGDWNAKREGTGMAGTSVLAQALVQFSGGAKTMDEVKAFLKTKSQAEKVALRNSPKIKPIVEAIEAEKASKAPSVDTDALLNAFAGGGEAEEQPA